MTETSTQARMPVMRARARVFFAVMGSAAIFLSGCAARRSQTIPWPTAVMVRPIAPQHATPATNVEDPLPDLRLEIPPPPAPLASESVPARPRSFPASPSENATPEKLEAPRIVPDLSPEQSATLQRETVGSLRAAEQNLSAAAGKTLNAVQADLASKVRSFISDARDAGRSGDWAQALDLARKAQVLSEQLAASL